MEHLFLGEPLGALNAFTVSRILHSEQCRCSAPAPDADPLFSFVLDPAASALLINEPPSVPPAARAPYARHRGHRWRTHRCRCPSAPRVASAAATHRPS